MIKLSSLKKVLVFSLSIFMFSFILTGCNDLPDNQKNDGSSSSSRAGDILTVTQTNDIKSLDPALAEDNYTHNVISNIYEGLLGREVENGNGETKIVGKLAESWEVSSDGKLYTFKLRKGVKFHDGTEFNAEVVKLNIDRQLDAIKNKNRKFGYATVIFPNVEKIEVVDQHTVEIYLKEAQTSFLGALSMDIGTGFVSRKALTDRANDPQGVSSQPIGTGPYKYVSNEKGQFVKLASFEGYWGGKAKIKNLVFKIIPDPQTQMFALKGKEVDIIKDFNIANEAQIKEGGNIVKKDPYLCTSYLIFNHKSDVFGKKEVRKAIGQAINVPELVKSLYKGSAEPAHSFLPKTIGGYDKDLKFIEHDPEIAKKTLESAGVKKIKIATYSNVKPYNSVGGAALAEAIQGYLQKNLGIEVVIDSREWVQYRDVIEKGDFDIACLGWSADFADASNFMQIFTEGSGMNYGKYSNKEYDDLFKKADTVPLGRERDAMYAELDKMGIENVAYFPLSHSVVANAMLSNIKGFYQPSVGAIPFYQISK